MAHSVDSVNYSIGVIEVLHARFGNELCDILKRRTGRDTVYSELVKLNNVIGWIVEALYDYIPTGISSLNNAINGLTEEELTSLINYGYRTLNKYGSEIHIPEEPNIFL